MRPRDALADAPADRGRRRSSGGRRPGAAIEAADSGMDKQLLRTNGRRSETNLQIRPDTLTKLS
jgi:hypothetical protein